MIPNLIRRESGQIALWVAFSLGWIGCFDTEYISTRCQGDAECPDGFCRDGVCFPRDLSTDCASSFVSGNSRCARPMRETSNDRGYR